MPVRATYLPYIGEDRFTRASDDNTAQFEYAVLNSTRRLDPAVAGAVLREQDVLRQLALGRTNRVIA